MPTTFENRSVSITGISEMQSVQIMIIPMYRDGSAYTTITFILRALPKYHGIYRIESIPHTI